MSGALGRLVEALGVLVGSAGRAVVRLPGLVGAGCGVAAAWEAFGRPAGLAVAALFLLVMDRRMP